jgi:hypothetical protein
MLYSPVHKKAVLTISSYRFLALRCGGLSPEEFDTGNSGELATM